MHDLARSLESEPAQQRAERLTIRCQARPPSLAALDMTKRVKRKQYNRRLSKLQLKIKEVALSYLTHERRAVVVFEGPDAAGKGGAIRRMSWPLDPRDLKVWPIAAPTPEDKGHHYLYRFWKRLPRPGQLVIFDRSWYGRVLVERIEGFATEAEWSRAYEEINEFERMLYDDGIRPRQDLPSHHQGGAARPISGPVSRSLEALEAFRGGLAQSQALGRIRGRDRGECSARLRPRRIPGLSSLPTTRGTRDWRRSKLSSASWPKVLS